MKKSLIVLLSALCVSGLNAQDYNLGGNKFGDNWSIGLNGGIATPLTHSTFFKNSRAVIGLDINKQLSPIYGLTLESNWTINTQSRMAAQKSGTAFDAFNLMLLNRLNLNNMFAGYNGQPRLFEVEAVGGFGWLRLNDFYETGEGANHLANHRRCRLSLQEQQRQAPHDESQSLRRIGSQRIECYHQQLTSRRKLQG